MAAAAPPLPQQALIYLRGSEQLPGAELRHLPHQLTPPGHQRDRGHRYQTRFPDSGPALSPTEPRPCPRAASFPSLGRGLAYGAQPTFYSKTHFKAVRNPKRGHSSMRRCGGNLINKSWADEPSANPCGSTSQRVGGSLHQKHRGSAEGI